MATTDFKISWSYVRIISSKEQLCTWGHSK